MSVLALIKPTSDSEEMPLNIATTAMRAPIITALLVLAVLGLCTAQASANSGIEPFVGSYTGSARMVEGEDITPRDLAVKITAEGRHGFKVRWTSLTYKSDGRKKRSTHEIEFQRSKREGVYRSAMRENMFGQAVPNDPIDGEPYVWATLVDKTLVIHSLHVLEDGEYELQTYRRTLVAAGLRLEFLRLRNGVPFKTVTATLIKR